MTKSMTNLLVDAALGLAFALTAVSGIVLLLPSAWLADGLLGIDYPTWLTLHNWGGAFIIVGVTLHGLLHLRWIGHMLRRLAGGSRRRRPGSRPRPSAADPRLERARGREEGPAGAGYTRKQVLGGAALTFGAALAGGLFADRLSNIRSTSTSTSDGSAQGAASATDSATADESDEDVEAGASSASDQSGLTRVSVDTGACIGCGHCLRACPEGVFAADSSGTRAVAAYPEACVLCRRCLGVCPAAAISLNA